MAATKRPGTNSGPQGGIYQEVTHGGAKLPNFTTVPENRPMPPTQRPGDSWKPISKTPHGKR